MNGLTLHQLLCFDAVASEGSFQAAALKLNRTHPTVFTAIKNLEGQLGLRLFDRGGYRVKLTPAGDSFHRRARILLRELGALRDHAAHLAMGEESELGIVIGDLCPLPDVLGLLRRFFDARPATRLHLHFEAISGPWERLLDGEADLILHHIDKTDPRLDFVDLGAVRLVPVMAPNFLAAAGSEPITPERLRDHVQCIIRDTARHSSVGDYYVIEGARSWTVSDQLMKKEIILQGMGWGHMPTFLVADELADGRLVALPAKAFPGGTVELVAARRRATPHGPVAMRLWRYIEEQAPALRKALMRQMRPPSARDRGSMTGSRRLGMVGRSDPDSKRSSR
jgi:DNA-binding transcriptional LysR family regulator